MQSDKLRWWSIYHEPEHELVGRIQLYINYSTIVDENSHLKVHLRSYPLLSFRNTCYIFCFMLCLLYDVLLGILIIHEGPTKMRSPPPDLF